MSIPIKAAEKIAKEFHCKQVILVAWDGEETHVVSYGINKVECAQAALGADLVMKALGWPEPKDKGVGNV